MVTVRGGDEVPGDHPLVKAAPAVFVLKGTPKHSWPSPLEESNKLLGQQEANQRRMREQDEELARKGTPALDPSTPISELRRATQAILSSA